jgi:hypothetical protein
MGLASISRCLLVTYSEEHNGAIALYEVVLQKKCQCCSAARAGCIYD